MVFVDVAERDHARAAIRNMVSAHAADTDDAKTFTLSDTMMSMIKTDSVKMCSVADELQLSGEVSYDENKVFKVYPRSSGQVMQCHLTLGDKVSAGQTLAVIKSADVAGNYADVSSADADITIARNRFSKAALPANANTTKPKRITRKH